MRFIKPVVEIERGSGERGTVKTRERKNIIFSR